MPRGIRGEGIELLLSVPHPSFETLDSLADRFTQAMDDVSVALWLCRVVGNKNVRRFDITKRNGTLQRSIKKFKSIATRDHQGVNKLHCKFSN